MRIRHSTANDLERIMEIYARARAFMAAHGNPRQWGATNWPPEPLIREDIRRGKSYVCVDEAGTVTATFFYDFGYDIEKTYRQVEGGAWRDAGAFGVVHRLASAGTEKGTGAFCLKWAFEQSGHLKVDTHPDNAVMRALLRKQGFTEVGVIYVEEDDDPRIAFEK